MPFPADFLRIIRPAAFDFELVSGVDRVWTRTLQRNNGNGTFTPYDLSNLTMQMQVRSCYDGGLIYAPTIAPTENAAAGEFSITFAGIDTARIGIPPRTGCGQRASIGVHDIRITDGSLSAVLLAGNFFLIRRVSA